MQQFYIMEWPFFILWSGPSPWLVVHLIEVV